MRRAIAGQHIRPWHGPMPSRVITFNVRSSTPMSSFDPARDRYLNIDAFSQPAPYMFGNAPARMPHVRTPFFYNEDFSVFKNFPITESKTIQFRWENYNFTNTPPLNAPDGTLGSGSFGRITTAGNGREMQFALRFQF